ncbi:MAG: HAMP domain-containing protein [Candidatus Eisenbacteria bacterium]|uniref:histidine kinase n=1 Tax=Eiseniibacteriota bacterium TaxID=2212470 RepID=A0A849T0X1_UNCEI|nr:HAMP domain-containing protein [Candidatus Eisenbacteria bacterium]
MNSLRLRLMLGVSLVAIVPLAIALALMSQRIQRTVEAQAAERLSAALGSLQTQLAGDAARLTEKLGLLARDPQMKRLYLVESASSAELSRYLADQQFLLDLDFLFVVDAQGRLIADAATAPTARARLGREPLVGAALGEMSPDPLALTAVQGAPALVLDAAQSIRYRDELVGRIRGGVLLDSTLLARLARTSGVELVLYAGRGEPIATSLRDGEALPAIGNQVAERVEIAGRSYLAQRRALAIGSEPHVQLAGLAATSSADETLAALRWTSLSLGLLGVLIAMGLGVLWSRQVSRPVERLARFSDQIARGEWDQPLAMESVGELQTLVASLERMRTDLRSYRERLSASERQAAYGQMARKVAHEIKNPLTPIAVSIADLKRSYDQNRADFPHILEQAVRTIGEEVHALKRLINEFSEFGRFPPPQFVAFDVAELVTDLKTLYRREFSEARLTFDPAPATLRLEADRAQLRQVLLNLIQNGLDAAAPTGRVNVGIGSAGQWLELVVHDDGPGLTDEQRAQLFVPGFTSKAHGSGLGLTIVERIVTDHGGTIAVESTSGHGATFRVRLPMRREV